MNAANQLGHVVLRIATSTGILRSRDHQAEGHRHNGGSPLDLAQRVEAATASLEESAQRLEKLWRDA